MSLPSTPPPGPAGHPRRPREEAGHEATDPVAAGAGRPPVPGAVQTILSRRAVPPDWDHTAVWFDGSGRHGTRVEVFTVGDPRHPPLAFIHGWGLSPRGYATAINALAHRGWHVVAPALPGFGDSTPVRGGRGTLARTAERTAEAIDALALPLPIPVVAHSYGSGVTIAMALARRDLFESITLVCPIGGAGSKATSWAGLAAGLRHEVGRSTLTRVVDSLPNLLRHPRAVASAGVAAKHSDLVAAVAEVAADGCPVSMLLASHDGVVPPARLRLLHAHDGVTIIVVEGNHGFLLTDPELFADLAPHPG